MGIRIISLGFAAPQYSVSQDEALACLGLSSQRSRLIFKNTLIENRYSYIEPSRVNKLSWQEQTEEYERGALELSIASVRDCLGVVPISAIEHITFASVSGYTCPSMSYAIAGELGLKSDVRHTNILGQGCQAAAPSVERAYDGVKVHGGYALAIATEICTASHFPIEDESDIEYIVAASLFGDGSSTALIGESDNPHFPELLDFESFYDPEFLRLLGYKWEDGRMKVVLSRRVPEIVPPLIKKTVVKMLDRSGLTLSDINTWMIHPGGRAVLENIERELGLTREDTLASWEVMRQYGNMSSATIGRIAKYVQHHMQPSGYGVAVTMGAGTAVSAMLMRWGDV